MLALRGWSTNKNTQVENNIVSLPQLKKGGEQVKLPQCDLYTLAGCLNCETLGTLLMCPLLVVIWSADCHVHLAFRPALGFSFPTKVPNNLCLGALKRI